MDTQEGRNTYIFRRRVQAKATTPCLLPNFRKASLLRREKPFPLNHHRVQTYASLAREQQQYIYAPKKFHRSCSGAKCEN